MTTLKQLREQIDIWKELPEDTEVVAIYNTTFHLNTTMEYIQVPDPNPKELKFRQRVILWVARDKVYPVWPIIHQQEKEFPL